ncbi:MAG: hypothetical protein ABFD82_20245, partial [Syntrophaceae bacterium]
MKLSRAIIIVVFLLMPLKLYAACSGSSPNWTAADCSNTEIQACINGATSGDTVYVPAGTCTWTGAVTIPETKTIKLIGAGSSSTIISY